MCILYVQNSRNRQKTGSTLKCTIEHIEPQSLTRGTENWKKELEYSNFLAVCSGNENRGALCCDKSRGNKKLFLTPLNPECNHLIQYSYSGKILAAETIPAKEDRDEINRELNDILNLNDGKDLKTKRKNALMVCCRYCKSSIKIKILKSAEES